MHRNSRAQKDNAMTSLFENFFPNQRVQIDFAEKGSENYLVMCDVMSGFFQVYRVANKSAEQAILGSGRLSGADLSSSSRTGVPGSVPPSRRRPPSSALTSSIVVGITALARPMWSDV